MPYTTSAKQSNKPVLRPHISRIWPESTTSSNDQLVQKTLSFTLRYEETVMDASKLYRKLPETETPLAEERDQKRARDRSTQYANFSSDSPFKRRCVVDSDTTDSD